MNTYTYKYRYTHTYVYICKNVYVCVYVCMNAVCSVQYVSKIMCTSSTKVPVSLLTAKWVCFYDDSLETLYTFYVLLSNILCGRSSGYTR